jgi:hypothetical protein
MINSVSSSGRFGDWLSHLVSDKEHPERPAKVYKMMSDDSRRHGHENDALRFMAEAVTLWPEVVNWTGRGVPWLEDNR